MESVTYARFVGPEKKGQTRALRNSNLPENSDFPRTYKVLSHCDTPIKCFLERVEINPDNNCLGSREKLENGNFGEYKWKTYKEVK